MSLGRLKSIEKNHYCLNLVPRFWIGNWKAKNNKPPSVGQILAEFIKAGCSTICSQLHKLTNSMWNREELPEQWNEPIVIPIDKKGDKKNVFIVKACHLVNYIQNSNTHLSSPPPYREEIIENNTLGVDFNVIFQLMIIYFFIRPVLEKAGNKMKHCISIRCSE
jgi:hypothetical protein